MLLLSEQTRTSQRVLGLLLGAWKRELASPVGPQLCELGNAMVRGASRSREK